MTTEIITQARLKEVLHYDPASGIFTWISRVSIRITIGSIAGYTDQYGYTLIRVDKRLYRAHRLACLYVNGALPMHEVDHIDHDPANNRIANLRPVPHITNHKNQSLSKRNKSGVTGVRWLNDKKKWRVEIGHNGTCFYGRSHKSFHKAVAIRKALEVMLNYHPNHGL